MQIRILSLGCSWWARAGKDSNDPFRFTRRAAYFNSTGIVCGKKVRRHWVSAGMVRFNGTSGFVPQYPMRVIGRVFKCSEVGIWLGGTRIVFQQISGRGYQDYCLVTLNSEEHGVIDLAVSGWKSERIKVIAISQLRNKQEVMLLMNIGDWVKSNCGTWLLDKQFGSAQLFLTV